MKDSQVSCHVTSGRCVPPRSDLGDWGSLGIVRGEIRAIFSPPVVKQRDSLLVHNLAETHNVSVLWGPKPRPPQKKFALCLAVLRKSYENWKKMWDFQSIVIHLKGNLLPFVTSQTCRLWVWVITIIICLLKNKTEGEVKKNISTVLIETYIIFKLYL